jgi:hypothetical protein
LGEDLPHDRDVGGVPAVAGGHHRDVFVRQYDTDAENNTRLERFDRRSVEQRDVGIAGSQQLTTEPVTGEDIDVVHRLHEPQSNGAQLHVG